MAESANVTGMSPASGVVDGGTCSGAIAWLVPWEEPGFVGGDGEESSWWCFILKVSLGGEP